MRLLRRLGRPLAKSPLMQSRLANIAAWHRHSSGVCQFSSLCSGQKGRNRALIALWLAAQLYWCIGICIRIVVDIGGCLGFGFIVGFEACKHLQPTRSLLQRDRHFCCLLFFFFRRLGGSAEPKCLDFSSVRWRSELGSLVMFDREARGR